MSNFIAVPHQAEIAVKYEKDDQSVTITIDECPNVSDPELGIFRELELYVGDVPALIKALQDVYNYAQDISADQ